MASAHDGYGRLIHTHGYGGYSRGCRCAECRAAKAAYMRARRAEAAALAVDPPSWQVDSRGRYVAYGITHGTASGYVEHACRCGPCTTARATQQERQRRRRTQGRGY